MLGVDPLAYLELVGGPEGAPPPPVLTPVVGFGRLAIIAGDDYQATESRQLQFQEREGAVWPSLSGATVTFTLKRLFGASVLVTTGEIITTTPPQEVDVNLSHASTTALVSGQYDYDLVAYLSSGHFVSLNRGTASVSQQASDQLVGTP